VIDCACEIEQTLPKKPYCSLSSVTCDKGPHSMYCQSNGNQM